MSTRFAAYTQEFAVLVQKAARDGFLDPYVLLSAYAGIKPEHHAEIDNAERLDLEALVWALSQLPQGYAHAKNLVIVPNLTAFSHTPLPTHGFLAGHLEDGTLLIEAIDGHKSLMTIAAVLCTITHEITKAVALRRKSALDVYGMAVANEQDTHDTEGDTSLSLARVALVLGVDEMALHQANDATAGELFGILFERDDALPDALIHAELQPAFVQRKRDDTASRMMMTLAELGLLHRPIHLWIGGGAVVDCVSPYGRDLQQPLLQWAQENPDLLGKDIRPLPDIPLEDVIACILHDFLQTDERLVEERRNADRTVGIVHHESDGVAFQTIDMARIDPNGCDTRLQAWPTVEAPPVILRVDLQSLSDSETLIKRLLDALAPRITGITLILQGAVVDAPVGSIVLPDLIMDWAGEHTCLLNSASPWRTAELMTADGLAIEGRLFSVPTMSLFSRHQLRELTAWHIQGICFAGMPLVTAIRDAIYLNTLPRLKHLNWALVSTELLPNGRMNLASTASHAALAISQLRRLLSVPKEVPPPSPPPPAKMERESSVSAIKAAVGLRKPYAQSGVRIKV